MSCFTLRVFLKFDLFGDIYTFASFQIDKRRLNTTIVVISHVMPDVSEESDTSVL